MRYSQWTNVCFRKMFSLKSTFLKLLTLIKSQKQTVCCHRGRYQHVSKIKEFDLQNGTHQKNDSEIFDCWSAFVSSSAIWAKMRRKYWFGTFKPVFSLHLDFVSVLRLGHCHRTLLADSFLQPKLFLVFRLHLGILDYPCVSVVFQKCFIAQWKKRDVWPQIYLLSKEESDFRWAMKWAGPFCPIPRYFS